MPPKESCKDKLFILKGFKSRIINIEKHTEFIVSNCLYSKLAIIIKQLLITALITEICIPVNTIKNNKNITEIIFPFLFAIFVLLTIKDINTIT